MLKGLFRSAQPCGGRFVLLAGFMVLLVAALGIGMGTPAPARAASKVTVTVWTSATGPYPEIQAKLEKDFEAKHPNIDVKLEYIDWTQVQTKLLAGLAGGVTPDMVLLPTRYAPSFIEQGLLAPVDYKALGLSSQTDFAKLFLPGVAGALDFGGKFYFLPTELTWLGLYYNKSMLDAAGIAKVPNTWEELGQLGGKLTRIGPGGVERAGLALCRWGPFTGFWFLSMMRSLGEDWLKDGKPNFSSPRSVAALQVFADLYNRYRAAIPEFESQENFEAGKIGFIAGLSMALAGLREAIHDSFELRVAEYPHLASGRPANIAYAWGYFVLANSKHQAEAWKVAYEFTSPENAPFWYKTGSLFVPRGDKWVAEMAQKDADMRTLLGGLSVATMELAHPRFDDIIREINVACNDIVLKGLGVASAMAELDARLTKILKR